MNSRVAPVKDAILARELVRPHIGLLTLSGYGIRVVVKGGHLVVEDGFGSARRRGRFSRATAAFKRLVILGHCGTVSLEALRWLHDIGAAFVQIDNDGELIVAAGPSGLNDARLRRAQALAITNGVALKISRTLIRQKLEAQINLLQRLPKPGRAFWELSECLADIANAKSIEDLRLVEARIAVMYWSAWPTIPVRFETVDAKRIPEHWLTFGSRHSLLNSSPRRATNPANAILNYLYAIVEAEARIAALRMGLDPGLGLMHADQDSRNSLPCDLMEPIRPKVDAYLFDLLQKRIFRKADFF